MNLHAKIMGIIIIYCAIFAWMSVPFITADEDILRKQVMFIDSLQNHIIADSSALVAPN